LARMAEPDVAVITTVAAAHLAAFRDVNAIAREKASILEGLKAGGTAVLNADIATASILREAADTVGATQVWFGQSDGADYRLIEARLTAETTVVQAALEGTKSLFKIGAPGRHFVMNALATLAAVRALGLDTDVAASDLGGWAPPAGRGTRETIVLDQVEDDLTIDLIDDAFNANPASMAASLEMLAAARPVDGIGRVARGRRIAVLGDMLELGPTEMAIHAEIADLSSMKEIEQVHCVGPRMRALWEAMAGPQRGIHVATAEDMLHRVHALFDAGDVVLVKGSKGSRVSLVVDGIRKLGHRRPRQEQGAE